jgi:hypothetical protein
MSCGDWHLRSVANLVGLICARQVRSIFSWTSSMYLRSVLPDLAARAYSVKRENFLSRERGIKIPYAFFSGDLNCRRRDLR